MFKLFAIIKKIYLHLTKVVIFNKFVTNKERIECVALGEMKNGLHTSYYRMNI